MTSSRSGSASSFPHHLWAGPAPPVSAWLSHLCVVRLLCSSPFWSARSANRLTRSVSMWRGAPEHSRFRKESTNSVLSSTMDLRSVKLRSSTTFMLSVSLPQMKLTIFLAAYRACSGGSVTEKALRMVLIHCPKAFHALNSALPPPSRMTHQSGMKVSPRTGLIRNLANFQDSVG